MTSLAHIGIAVRDLDAALGLYTKVLGLVETGREVLTDRGLEVAFVSAGESKIELLRALAPDNPVAKFIETRGEGIHHLAFEVEDVAAALERARAAGIALIDEKPRAGAGGAQVAFLHPKSTGGVLIEFCRHG